MVIVDGMETWINTNTIRKRNWQLKEQFMRSGLVATDIILADKLHYYYEYAEGQRHFGKDVPEAAFLHTSEYFENRK